MWFFFAVVLILLGVAMFYRTRHRYPETSRSGKDRESTEMEVSTDIGVPLEALDHQKAAQIDRLSGVARPRARPGERLRESHPDGSLATRRLRKDNLSKEVELVWEAGEMIELQPGAWARLKDFPDEPRGSGAQAPEEIKVQKRRDLSPRDIRDERYTLPKRYGVDRLVLLARDPGWVYAYWEITHEKYQEMYQKHLKEWGLSRPLIRLYDVTPGIDGSAHVDVFINEDADNWYINLGKPRHAFYAELGRLFPEKGFIGFLRSNVVVLPPDDLSDEISEEWAPLDWTSFYGKIRWKLGPSSPWM
ncbi:MAG TPA: DUF4912 domain-containing protein [Firmicutes bacterium]|nr:DUF4912 domain-containing protein [Candidatus Fermentithermobacillaceae bacterium]